MNARTILALAPGSSNLHYSEFCVQGSELTLVATGEIPLSPDGSPPSNRDVALANAFSLLVKSGHTSGRHVCLSIPANQVFTRFIRLPRVEDLKLKQMMYYEAKQNLPFSPEELIWDFQALNEQSSEEREYLLAAVRPDTIESLFGAAEAAGLKVELVDIPQSSLANAWKYNYSELTGCTLLVDIGAKSTQLLFFQGDQFYCRTLNIGAHALTQEFMAETRCSFKSAEEFKRDQGFIHPGGVFVLSETDDQLLFSKLAREWVTKVHQQIAQTIQHFRSQMNGRNPERVLLAGLGSTLGGMEEFFAEKFGVPVDVFNPFRKISIDPALEGTAMARTAAAKGETLGLALRIVANCPFELNFIPKSIRAKKAWEQKRPYLFAATVCLVGSLLGTGYFYSEIARIKRESLFLLGPKLEKLAAKMDVLEKERKALAKTREEVNQLTHLLNEKFLWSDTLGDMQKVLLQAEAKYSEPGRPAGVWIESFKPAGAEPEAEQPLNQDDPQAWPGIPEYLKRDPVLLKRYFPDQFEQMSRSMRPQFSDKGGEPKKTVGEKHYTMLLRAVNMATAKQPGKNSQFAFDVAEIFAGEERFSSPGTRLRNHIENVAPDEATFTFDMNLEIQER